MNIVDRNQMRFSVVPMVHHPDVCERAILPRLEKIHSFRLEPLRAQLARSAKVSDDLAECVKHGSALK
jgi:hypothetical protein